MLAKQWIKLFFISIIFVITLVSGINYIVNPYNIFGHGYDSLFKNKPEILSDEMTRFYVANRVNPQTIMLGTSRIAFFPEEQLAPYLKGPIYNLGMRGSTINEQIDYLEYMINHHNIKNIVWALDFFAFNPTKPNNPVFEQKRLSDSIYYDDYQLALFSFNTLDRSIKTIEKNLFSKTDQEQNLSREQIESNIRDVLHQFATDKIYLKSEEFKEPSSIDPKIERLKKIIALCQQKKINCFIYISPVYYLHIDMIYSIGLGTTFEYWKKSLATVHPYTDFCTYSSLSKDLMQFKDSSHTIPSVGNLIFARIFDPNNPLVPSDFGYTVTLKNIDIHINEQRELHHNIDVYSLQRNNVDKHQK